MFPAFLSFDELIGLFCANMHVQSNAPSCVTATIWDRHGDARAQYDSQDDGATFALTSVYPTVHYIAL